MARMLETLLNAGVLLVSTGTALLVAGQVGNGLFVLGAGVGVLYFRGWLKRPKRGSNGAAAPRRRGWPPSHR